jgi:hypothetical protein
MAVDVVLQDMRAMRQGALLKQKRKIRVLTLRSLSETMALGEKRLKRN